MSKISTIGSLPTVHNFDQKKSHPLQFPLENDVAILQSSKNGPNSRFNWQVLKSLNSVLKMGQIVAAVLILTLTRTRARSYSELVVSLPENSYIFLSINALMVTAALLGDSIVTVHPLRQAFTPVLRNKVELWFTGLVAVAFHTLAYSVLAMNLNYHGIGINIVAAVFGFANASLYFVDWCMNFNRRHVIRGMLCRGEISEYEQDQLSN
ncbi:uncharacterized protein LOC134210715 [Armigeres subalbatus]|uniref:uncharacterized protein LOC134210715 n=1 Tax=Armigeres subalbatus TaxID=124917 RepID=UPI002ED6840C